MLRLWAAVLALLAAMVVPWVAASAPAQAAVPGQAYNLEILNAGQPTGLCLAINWANTGPNNGFALLAQCHAYIDRSFVIVPNKGTTMMALQNGVCLDRWGTSRSNGVPLAGYPCASNDISQQFHLTQLGGGLLQWSDGTHTTCAHGLPAPVLPQIYQHITQGSCATAPSWRLDPVATPKPAFLHTLAGGCAADEPKGEGPFIRLDPSCSFGFWDLPEDGTANHGLLGTGNSYGKCMTAQLDGFDPCVGGPSQVWNVAAGADNPAAYQFMSSASAPGGCVQAYGGFIFMVDMCSPSAPEEKWLLVTG